ncbi:MAG: hypothetical protein H6718_35745 [Polyangiaceae bacterium]|nr:hypothetical protein [Myxococcales bacterium]MCB9590817.1 hypothetical protein [Polyangiaceae bacterium]
MGKSARNQLQRRTRGSSRVRLSHGLLLIALLGLMAGCSGYVKRGSALYADGRYIEAAEVFERTEHRLNESNAKQQAEYGLYRGLTLLVLGDTGGARRWLSYAYQVERANPGTLRGNRRALLDRGWVELQSRGELPPGPAAPAMAAQPMPVMTPEPAPRPGPSPAPPARRSLMPQ